MPIAAPCSALKDEISARIAGQKSGSWVDQHNKGKYSVLKVPDGDTGVVEVQRQTNSTPVYTDKINFALVADGEGACKVFGRIVFAGRARAVRGGVSV